ncbi:MAG: hypothetical protein PHT78_11075 [Desulfitobacteriaceae bacterium]|nr:hypothetical protein [Desulfitobacteriaceae bacterium]MDD4753766.1 hypothetical protein [Desulfitobacteriaceae bacterium]
MGETRKVTFFIYYPAEKNALGLMKEVKRKVKEIRENNPELNQCELADVGLCRLVDGVRVTLYFGQKEKLELGRS